MMRANVIVFVVVVVAAALGLAPGVAAAQAFEAKAETATRIAHVEDVVWAFTTACATGDEVQQRQCRLVRDQRQKALAGALLLVEGEASALELAKWSPQKKSMNVKLTSCIRCAGVEVDGKTWFVTGGAPRFEGQRAKAPVLVETAQQFPDEASAAAWSKPLAEARVQYLVKVPARPKWTASGRQGLALEVVGYRVIDPCDGSIVVANPTSAAVAGDKAHCAAEPPAPVRDEKLPDGLTGQMIKAAMQPVVDAANACFARHKASGTAKLAMTVAGDGTVSAYAQEGDFVGSPTAACIDTAAKKVTFPRTQRPKQKLTFPIVLR